MDRSEVDVFAYMMAAEKMVAMLSMMEQNMEFFEEYKIHPDGEVKKALIPLVKRLNDWVNA